MTAIYSCYWEDETGDIFELSECLEIFITPTVTDNFRMCELIDADSKHKIY